MKKSKIFELLLHS